MQAAPLSGFKGVDGQARNVPLARLSDITQLTLLLVGGGLFLSGCQEAPIALQDSAKAALDSAAAAGAVRYAEKTYREAEATLRDGILEVAHQKGRLAPLRRYDVADSLLGQAYQLGQEAQRLTRERLRSLEDQARTKAEELRQEVQNWRKALDGSLAIYRAERLWANADIQLRMCEKLCAEEEFDASLEAASKSREFLVQLGNLLAEYANDEASMLNYWRRWVRETLAESRSDGSYAIIVDKSAHKAYLLKSGSLFHTYGCEFGYNSARQKLFAGDGATPEGKYHVVAKRSNGSKYYKALLLDYPNQLDNQRFRQNKAKGIISSRAGIGKNIEIHGGGGKNQDWTDGCVALTNDGMDHLMKYVNPGTAVTIVRRSDQWP